MRILKQDEQIFKTRKEIEEYIANKEEALLFWTMIKSIDMSDLVHELEEGIKKAKQRLLEWK